MSDRRWRGLAPPRRCRASALAATWTAQHRQHWRRVKPFIQTLHKSVAISADKLGGANVSLKIVGSHPLMVIVCIQLNENCGRTAGPQHGDVAVLVRPRVPLRPPRRRRRLDTAGPYGYEFVSSGVAKCARQSTQRLRGPDRNLQMSANANVRHLGAWLALQRLAAHHALQLA